MITGGKLSEELKIQTLFLPQSRTAATTLYNGGSSTGNAIDTQGFDELLIVLQSGTFGAGGSVTPVRLLECATDSVASAEAISGAAFTTLSASNDEDEQIAMIQVKNYKRYVYLETTQANTTATLYGAIAILGKADKNPQSNSPVFDL